jgi:hypothetical protein
MSLDQDIQIRSLDGLVGHTIKAVIENPIGKREVDIVIVTETGCWLALNAEAGSFDEAPTIETDPPYYGGDDVPLENYLSAREALHHGLINMPTYELLKEKERKEAEEQKKAKADRLRRQLAELEGGAA